ncbi:D-tyrosyl-tRNA(Tyr) deacylase [Nonlabens dokdonensis]|jgi:D-tyrosyl-tRNA(Tyr) deacylase|uniref:D-aminoacyl-tRNA deacylase n=2 Tax=Nonlabens dokdonensis TaxID=328515 RepID=L7WA71_NONDD|nr:D-aminoacyl-tRNA deacylase [Nonlabens dokdonensis]AGC77034.1 D-tyrosyl-tRNA(Tyr) deacylase [Nonlabens dokdonensis DSW-6]PZX40996.1 D-tyrosyl-tRNA(Tyr) deacylase [Nonlabens dokdonensis]
MRAVIQRVSEASVIIDNKQHAAIEQGLLILLGITHEDTQEDIDWLAGKIIGMRIFSDQEDKMNLSIQDIDGELLLISQFTLFANTKKGNRPSYINAARPEVAVPLYEAFLSTLSRKRDKEIKSGIFGADMKVALVNDGPVTIIIDSQDRNL